MSTKKSATKKTAAKKTARKTAKKASAPKTAVKKSLVPKERERTAEASHTQYADHPVNTKLSAEEKLDLLREMIRVRRFEERCLPVYQKGKIGGFLHLYIGQEAVSLGTISVLDMKKDHVITAYRDHGHALNVGMSMNECMAELLGKASGCSKGKGGSMHFFAPDKGFWGGHGIVAGQTPLGLGMAFALKYNGIDGVVLCYMGDGAVNQGAYHEALNLAALWDIPVIYIIENNGYSMGTSQERSSAGDSLAARADGYGIKWDVCDGHLIYETRAVTADLVEYARKNSKPVVLEIDTYRYKGHSVADPDKTYRTKDEIAEYRQTKDPIQLFRATLEEEGILTEAKYKEIDDAAKKEALAAVDFAEMSPFPEPEAILDDVYWETDNPEERTSKGLMFFETE